VFGPKYGTFRSLIIPEARGFILGEGQPQSSSWLLNSFRRIWVRAQPRLPPLYVAMLCLDLGVNLPLPLAKGVSVNVRDYTDWHYYAQVYTYVRTRNSHSAIPRKQACWRPILLHVYGIMLSLVSCRQRTGLQQSVWFRDSYSTVHGNIAWLQYLLVKIIRRTWRTRMFYRFELYEKMMTEGRDTWNLNETSWHILR
jgi:hypothetical protein